MKATDIDGDSVQTVLIVDDSLFICQQIKTILKNEKIRILEAHSGKEAIRILSEQSPDLILLDIILPDVEGYDLCRQIQEKNQNEVGIIFITSKDSDSDVMKGFSLGACDYIKKPFGHEELKSRVLTHLEIKKQKDEMNRINIELKKNMEKLNFMAFRDGLTGLYNRRYVQDDLMYKIQENDQKDAGSVFVMADVDDFKGVNDKYGHEAGDVALICISNIMEDICLNHKVIRWGGEEFLIVLFSVTKEEAFQISEKIRTRIQDFSIICQDVEFSCTATFGLYAYHASESMEQNIEKADRALYRGKRSGKNCCVWYDESSEDGDE